MTTPESEVYCTQCGAIGPRADLFCRQCGAQRGSVVRLGGDEPAGGRGYGSADQPSPGLGQPTFSPFGSGSWNPVSGRQNDESGAGRAAGKKLTSPPPPPSNWLEEPAESQPGLLVPMVPAASAPRSQPVRSISYPAAVAPPPAHLPARLTCSFCSMPIPAGADRCNNCGGSRALVASGMCFRCGAANPSSNRYCGVCGRLLVVNALSSQRHTTSALPVVGSIILPGLGQMMNGEAVKGFMLLGAALLMISTEPTILTPIYLLITAISAIDAALSQSRRERASYRAQDWA